MGVEPDLITYRLAAESDLEGVARIFMAAFPDSLSHYFRQPPTPWVVAEPFRLCLASEPAAFFVAATPEGEPAGYLFAPAQTSRLTKVALLRGFALRWLWRWVSGQYGIGLAPVRALALNKLDFLASARAPKVQAEARILSIAVHPAYQGQGIATALCRLGLARLDQIGASPVRLEVRPDNAPAMALYQGLGFQTVGSTRDAQGEWVIMLRNNVKSNDS